MAGSTGLEPATSGLTVQCANQAAPRARASHRIHRPRDVRPPPDAAQRFFLVVSSIAAATRCAAYWSWNGLGRYAKAPVLSAVSAAAISLFAVTMITGR